MLNPTGSEPTAAAEDNAQRVRAPAAPRPPLNIDPSWRAGRKLAEARLQSGLSLEQIVQRTKVRREFLEALESMNAKLLPGKAYALAYLRSYARLLGLDEQAIVEQFQEECALSREDNRTQIRSPESRPHPERPWFAALALVAIAAGFVGWRALQDTDAADTPAAPVEAARPARPAVAPAPAVAQRQVEIRAVAPAWLEIRGPDGTVFLSRNMAPGDAYQPDASAGWTIHARDGGAFQLYVDGAPAGPLGDAGKPVLGRQIDSIEPLETPVLAPLTAPAVPVSAAATPVRRAVAAAPVTAAAPPAAAPAASETPAPTPAPAAPPPG